MDIKENSKKAIKSGLFVAPADTPATVEKPLNYQPRTDLGKVYLRIEQSRNEARYPSYEFNFDEELKARCVQAKAQGLNKTKREIADIVYRDAMLHLKEHTLIARIISKTEAAGIYKRPKPEDFGMVEVENENILSRFLSIFYKRNSIKEAKKRFKEAIDLYESKCYWEVKRKKDFYCILDGRLFEYEVANIYRKQG